MCRPRSYQKTVSGVLAITDVDTVFIPEATPVFLYRASLETLLCFDAEEVQKAY